jgi:hypothetical protein
MEARTHGMDEEAAYEVAAVEAAATREVAEAAAAAADGMLPITVVPGIDSLRADASPPLQVRHSLIDSLAQPNIRAVGLSLTQASPCMEYSNLHPSSAMAAASVEGQAPLLPPERPFGLAPSLA